MTTTVTATSGEESGTAEITDSYVLVTDGTAHQAHITVHNIKDGTQTHVITVKGIRP